MPTKMQVCLLLLAMLLVTSLARHVVRDSNEEQTSDLRDLIKEKIQDQVGRRLVTYFLRFTKFFLRKWKLETDFFQVRQEEGYQF